MASRAATFLESALPPKKRQVEKQTLPVGATDGRLSCNLDYANDTHTHTHSGEDYRTQHEVKKKKKRKKVVCAVEIEWQGVRRVWTEGGRDEKRRGELRIQRATQRRSRWSGKSGGNQRVKSGLRKAWI